MPKLQVKIRIKRKIERKTLNCYIRVLPRWKTSTMQKAKEEGEKHQKPVTDNQTLQR